MFNSDSLFFLLMKNKSEINLLDFIPIHHIEWKENLETNFIVLIKPKFENSFLKQHLLPLLKNPNFRINLDAYGSKVWKLIDGRRNIMQIADILKESYGTVVDPVYDRVGKFMMSLEKHKFITYRD